MGDYNKNDLDSLPDTIPKGMDNKNNTEYKIGSMKRLKFSYFHQHELSDW